MIAPFIFSDMSCPHCLNGSTHQLRRGGGTSATARSTAARARRCVSPWPASTLRPCARDGHSDEMLRSLLALSDVMATGHHAAVSAEVKQGGTVAVVGDGAVGLSAVLASKRLGAERIIALSRNPDRQKLALEFGATDIVEERGDAASEAVLELTDGIGADAALECVGTAQSIATAPALSPDPAPPSASWAYPTARCPSSSTFFRNIGWQGGPPPPVSTSRTSSPMCSPGRSTRARSSTSRPTLTTSPTPTEPWTSAGRSSHCCEWERHDDGHVDEKRT